MYNDTRAEDILFFDIETAAQCASLAEADEESRHLWQQRIDKQKNGEEYDLEESYEQAGFTAEWGRVVCISCGIIMRDEARGQRIITTTSFCSDDERALLQGFAATLNKFFVSPRRRLCGHNVREFDVPFVARRMLICGVPLPRCLDVVGLKPWDNPIIDTMEMWKFGKYRDAVQLKVLCHVFNVPTPKDDIDGNEVGRVFHQEHNLQRIATYCEKDVVATAKVFLKMRAEEQIAEARSKTPKTTTQN